MQSNAIFEPNHGVKQSSASLVSATYFAKSTFVVFSDLTPLFPFVNYFFMNTKTMDGKHKVSNHQSQQFFRANPIPENPLEKAFSSFTLLDLNQVLEELFFYFDEIKVVKEFLWDMYIQFQTTESADEMDANDRQDMAFNMKCILNFFEMVYLYNDQQKNLVTNKTDENVRK